MNKCLLGLYLIVCIAVVVKCDEEELIAYYTSLITNASVSALSYEYPEDASRYKPITNRPKEIGFYDFIIIGAGSTGSVIANRLSENRKWKVLVLEAGTFTNDVNDIPGLFVLSVLSDYNWGFKSIPQTTACLGTEERKCVVPRGRGIGGTALINELVYGRGNPLDYDRWAEHTNDPSWSYNNILKYFLKSEHLNKIDPTAPIDWPYHGTHGEFNVEHHFPTVQLRDLFLEAAKEKGYNVTDYNGPHQIGGTVDQYNTKNGRRFDQGTAFVLPVLNRTNLKVLTESYVTKIEIDRRTKVTTGVLFTRNGKTYRARVKKEVILSAGTISSPQILMLSGIGPANHLKKLGIPVIKDLPVGNNLREHCGPAGFQFSSNMTRISKNITETIRDFLNGVGSLTSSTSSHVIGFYKTVQENPTYPDLQIVSDLASAGSELGRKFLGYTNETYEAIQINETELSFFMTVVLTHSLSVGTVRLNSSNPFEYPLIDFNLLSDPENHDIDTIYEGIKLVMELANTTGFRSIGAQFQTNPFPACGDYEYLSKEYWYCYIRYTTVAFFHVMGTCSMGSDPKEAVVDSNLKVFGVKKLRVADASIFPLSIAGYINAVCSMVGEKISDVIKSQY